MRAPFRAAVVFVVCALPAALAPSGASADEAEVRYRICIAHKKAGKLDQAEQECKSAIEKRPDHGAAYYTLGTLQRQKGQLDLALASFKKVRELEPTNALGWAGEGAVLLRQEKNVEALKQAVALDPADTASVANLGNALRKTGKPEEAIAAYKKALEKDPNNPDLLNNLAVALRGQGKNTEAIEVLQRALAKKPGDPALSGNLAKALRAEKRYAEAIPPYEAAIKGHDKDAGLWFDLAYSYEQTGQKDKALAAYRKQLELIKAKDPKGAAYIQETIDKLSK
jgi:tetratricopeptide (TPR) repeat protein